MVHTVTTVQNLSAATPFEIVLGADTESQYPSSYFSQVVVHTVTAVQNLSAATPFEIVLGADTEYPSFLSILK